MIDRFHQCSIDLSAEFGRLRLTGVGESACLLGRVEGVLSMHEIVTKEIWREQGHNDSVYDSLTLLAEARAGLEIVKAGLLKMREAE